MLQHFAKFFILYLRDISKEVKQVEYQDYVIKAKKGDNDAFLCLYQMYRDKLYHYAWYRIGNSEDAMDAVSDTVLSAFEQIKSLKNPKAFSSWLFAIHRVSCNKYIKSIIAKKNEDDIETLELESKSTNDDLSLELREALSRLDQQEREIVLLSIVSGFTSEEIGRIIGLKAGSVRSKQSRALAKMRTFLE